MSSTTIRPSHDPTAIAAALLSDFDILVKERSVVELRALRVKELALFLGHGDVHPRALPLRVEFLERHGYSRDEIADALLDCGAPQGASEAMQLLEAGNGPLKRTSTSTAAGSGEQATMGASMGEAPPGSNPLKGAVVKDVGGSNLPPGHHLWRVGALVYAYGGDHTYFPVPLLGFDYSRFEDVYRVSHQLPSGEYGPPTYLAAGYKGVVPDELPAHELVRVGTTILVQPPQAYRGLMREALVLAVSPPTADGFYTVDIEWAQDGARAQAHSLDIRLLKHPKLVAEELEREEAERRKLLVGTADKTSSSNAFPTGGVGNVGRVGRGADHLHHSTSETGEAKDLVQGHVKNFIHFPDVDVYEQPRGMRTGASFSSQYGDPLGHGEHKGAPILPESQAVFLRAVLAGDSSIVRSVTSTGTSLVAEYGYNLTHVPRHPRSPVHMARNPIVQVARQSLMRDTMFVDPEFPPSFASFAGLDDATAEQKAVAKAAFTGPVEPHPLRAQVVWRRASEVWFRPRLYAVGAKPRSLVPGPYTPPWMVSLCIALSEAQELEDMVSPADDGWVYGAYVFRVFLEGSWYFVTIDDMIPCDAHTGAPLTCQPGTQSEIYAVLLEKVLAKICGSYAALAASAKSTLTLPRAWDIFTACATEAIDHRFLRSREDATGNLQSILTEEKCLNAVHAVVRNLEASHDGMRFLGCGFTNGATWHVRDIVSITHPVRLHKSHFFNVVRGDKDGEDIQRQRAIREQLLDGVDVNVHDLVVPSIDDPPVSYWLTADDYFIVFMTSYVLRTANNCQRAVVKGSYSGRAGCGTKVRGTQAFLNNPQVLLSLVQPTEVVVELQAIDPEMPPLTGAVNTVRPPGPKPKATSLQVHILKGEPMPAALTGAEPLRLIASSMEINLIDDEDARNFPSVCAKATLPAGGNYIIVPSVGDIASHGPGAVEYVVKVTSVSSFYLKTL